MVWNLDIWQRCDLQQNELHEKLPILSKLWRETQQMISQVYLSTAREREECDRRGEEDAVWFEIWNYIYVKF
jgi:hypothetical protein